MGSLVLIIVLLDGSGFVGGYCVCFDMQVWLF